MLLTVLFELCIDLRTMFISVSVYYSVCLVHVGPLEGGGHVSHALVQRADHTQPQALLQQQHQDTEKSEGSYFSYCKK